ncbi:MAG TPA: phosphoglucosamine mutase [Clostridiales bacterium]|nr:phosphoglucosamine mutase [Clostridiales bacterium]
MGRLFGTDGVRGVANQFLDAQLAYGLGRAGSYILAGETRHTPEIVVGRDTRISGDMLEAALIAGICSTGARALSLGVVPTPAVAALTRIYGADAGIVISASHNTYEYNGIKFFDSRGFKLPDPVEDEIERQIAGMNASDSLIPSPEGSRIGRHIHCKDAAGDYRIFLKEKVKGLNLKGMRIALDCANGAVSPVAPALLAELGADVLPIHAEPDGCNINQDCGSTHMESLCMHTRKSGAHIGLAFDGDADRMLAVDETGRILDGDVIMSILAVDMQKRGVLNGSALVATVMSNIGLELMAHREGLKLIKTKVGDRYVLEQMLAEGYVLGGEQSGHIILGRDNTTGDGLLTALKLLEVMGSTGESLARLAKVMEVFPEVLVNARVKWEKKDHYSEDTEIAAAIMDLEQEFNGEGRVLVRPSGTEPLIRIKIEGRDHGSIRKRAEMLAEIMERKLS